LQQLLIDIAYAAQQLHKTKPIRVWYVMLGQGSWKGIVLDSSSKIKLAESVIKGTPQAALASLKAKLESEIKQQAKKQKEIAP